MLETDTIALTRGFSAVIDAGDLPLIAGYSWHARQCRGRWYACAKTSRSAGTKTVYMHRLLMGASPGEEIDHEDGNGLNNRRSTNLRLCTRSQNNANGRAPAKAKSGYRGVYPHHSGGWIGRMQKDRKFHYTRILPTAVDAARARDVLARELFGEFAARSIAA